MCRRARLRARRRSLTHEYTEDPASHDTAVDWHGQLFEQLDWHWRTSTRPRLDGLTDEEYRWEPVPGCWNVRPRGTGTAPIQAGRGPFTCDFAESEPDPAPVTTIAWRLAHMTVGCFGARTASHFGGPPYDAMTYDSPATRRRRSRARHDLLGVARRVRSLDADALARPVGPAEGWFRESPMAALVFHINREAIHHLAEVPSCATSSPTADPTDRADLVTHVLDIETVGDQIGR